MCFRLDRPWWFRSQPMVPPPGLSIAIRQRTRNPARHGAPQPRQCQGKHDVLLNTTNMVEAVSARIHRGGSGRQGRLAASLGESENAFEHRWHSALHPLLSARARRPMWHATKHYELHLADDVGNVETTKLEKATRC